MLITKVKINVVYQKLINNINYKIFATTQYKRFINTRIIVIRSI